ncbi:MAG: ABC transporter ATP-binding protein [Lachnospiraceae bacterium]|nr:ABC transporter ATP-binding protein [Lachnospiraceae bacterium]
MSEENGAFLSVKDLVVEYTSGGQIVHAVNGVSFELEKGKTLGLVGETGAGKTTIAKSILRILPDPPAKIKSGQIMLDGQELLTAEENEMLKIRGNKVSMIFQDPMTALNPVMSVGEQIAEAVEIHQTHDKAKAKEQAIKMLEMVGIPAERYREYPHQFSGGMKQRVVIAMSLACSPELLLADEPTTALDVTIQAQVLDMIRDLRDRYQMAMILITHDLGVVAGICDEVAVVYAGEVIEYGTREELFDNPTHPYTNGLFDSLPTLTGEIERLRPIDGMPPDPTDLPAGCHFSPRCPFATEECRTKHPDLTNIGGTHLCRCFHPEGRND